MPPKDASIISKAIVDRNDELRDNILKTSAKSSSSQAAAGGGEREGGVDGEVSGKKPLEQLQQQVQLQLQQQQQQQAGAGGAHDASQRQAVQAEQVDAVEHALQQEATSINFSYVILFGCLSIGFLVAMVWLLRYSRVVTEDEKIV